MRLRDLFGPKRAGRHDRPTLASSQTYRAAAAAEPVVADGSAMSGPGGAAPGHAALDDLISPGSQIGRAAQTKHEDRPREDLPVETPPRLGRPKAETVHDPRD